MYSCQIEPGTIRPKIGRPPASLIESLASLPIQTAVDIDGV